MAISKPVVGFDLPENRISAGDAALYARPNDISDLARQIERLMDDATMRQRLGAIGRERAEGVLNWASQEQTLLGAYRAMLCGQAVSVHPQAELLSQLDTPTPLNATR